LFHPAASNEPKAGIGASATVISFNAQNKALIVRMLHGRLDTKLKGKRGRHGDCL
jgi:hypothetical protein